MDITSQQPSSTLTILTIVVRQDDMLKTKNQVIQKLAAGLKIDGFRVGRAPVSVAMKHLDNQRLYEAFLTQFVPQVVKQAVTSENIPAIAPPQVSVAKFVPFDSLEIEVKVEHIGQIKLGDLRQIKEKLPQVKVQEEDLKTVLQKIQLDGAEFKTAPRPAQVGDRVILDIERFNKLGQALPKIADYSLLLGQQVVFTPEFTEQIIGKKAGEQIEFSLPPATETVQLGIHLELKATLKTVEAVRLPKLDDQFIAKFGDFKNFEDFKQVIRAQILSEKEHQARMVFQGQIVAKLTEISDIDIPLSLIEAEITKVTQEHDADLKRYQLSLTDWLAEVKLSASKHEARLKQAAINRLKGGLILREIAQVEGLKVVPAEIEAQLKTYQASTTTKTGSADFRRDLQARLLTQKALAKLEQMVLAKK